ncbi:MAG TPA: NUDIX hydrolase [Spirochaetia bacterium]|nr:NUDIX hydrolase [Spirochaetia bacterium]
MVLKEVEYTDNSGAPHRWTYVERTNGQGAVVIVAVTEESRSILLIRQLRIPFMREIIEFPAGLVDPGETPEAAAHRELLEETGHAGRIVEVGPPVSTSAGMTTETVRMVHMIVSERPTAPQALEGSEQIEVLSLRRDECGEFLATGVREGAVFDAKVYLYLSQIAGDRS